MKSYLSEVTLARAVIRPLMFACSPRGPTPCVHLCYTLDRTSRFRDRRSSCGSSITKQFPGWFGPSSPRAALRSANGAGVNAFAVVRCHYVRCCIRDATTVRWNVRSPHCVCGVNAARCMPCRLLRIARCGVLRWPTWCVAHRGNHRTAIRPRVPFPPLLPCALRIDRNDASANRHRL